jgi:predicted RNase H-like nuclease (RuvC/YqgF family)
MIYIFENDNNNASWTMEGHLLSDEEKASAVIIKQLPVKEEVKGKIAVLKCRKSTGEVWYEYVDIPTTPENLLEKKIQSLEEENAELLLKSAATDTKVERLESENSEMMLRLANLELEGNL